MRNPAPITPSLKAQFLSIPELLTVERFRRRQLKAELANQRAAMADLFFQLSEPA